MKTILHYVHSLNIGGGSLHVEKLTTDLADDFTHLVVGCSGSYEQHLRNKLGENLYVGSLFSVPFTLFKLLLTKNIDVFHFHGRMAGLIGRLVTLFSKKTKIYTIHGFSFESDSFVKKHFFKIFEMLLIHVTSKVVFVSEDERKLYNNTITDKYKEKEVVIYNYQETTYVENREFTVLTSIKALYIGRMSHQKGVDILLHAVSDIETESFSLDLIGEGPSFLEYQSLASNLKLNQCKFLGAVPNASQLMAKYDVLIIPSRYEGMPYIMIEGVNARMPIICTPARGIKEFLNNGNSYVADDIDATSLSKIINLFVNDYFGNTIEVEQRIKNSSLLIFKEFNKDVQLAKIKAIYL